MVAVVVRAAFCWKADYGMIFLVNLLRECPAEDQGDGSGDLRAATPTKFGHRG
jgi:hypothetical protein